MSKKLIVVESDWMMTKARVLIFLLDYVTVILYYFNVAIRLVFFVAKKTDSSIWRFIEITRSKESLSGSGLAHFLFFEVAYGALCMLHYKKIFISIRKHVV